MHTQTSHYQQGSPVQPARTSKASRLEQSEASNKTSPKRANNTSNLQRTTRGSHNNQQLMMGVELTRWSPTRNLYRDVQQKGLHLNQSVGTEDEETEQWLTNIPTYSSHHRKTADPLSLSFKSGRQTSLQLQTSLEIRACSTQLQQTNQLHICKVST